MSSVTPTVQQAPAQQAPAVSQPPAAPFSLTYTPPALPEYPQTHPQAQPQAQSQPLGPQSAAFIQPQVHLPEVPEVIDPTANATAQPTIIERENKAIEPGDRVRILGTAAPRPSATPRRGLEAELAEELEDKARHFAQQSATQQARATERSTSEQPKRHHRTGAGARLNADHIALYHLSVWGTIFVAAAAVAISWNGLSAAAAWLLLPPHLTWLLPAALDVTIVVFTLATLARRSRGEGVALLLLGAYGLTAISAATNALHVWLESPRDLTTATNAANAANATTPTDLAATDLAATATLEIYVGTALAALAPMLILLTTEVLGTIITKPSARDRRAQALREQAELARLTRDLDTAKKPRKTQAARKPQTTRTPAATAPAKAATK